MLDPHNFSDTRALSEAVWDSRRRYEPYKNNVRRVVEDFTGPGYGTDYRRGELPLNRGMLAVVTYVHKLISGEIRTLYTSRDPQLEIAQLEREAAMNEWIIRNIDEQLFMWVLSAIMSPQGILKVGIAPYQTGNYDDPGKLGLWYISQDDWVQDMMAKSQDDWAFCGHSYRVPYERVMQDMTIHDERLRRLSAMPYRPVDEFGNDKIQTVSRGTWVPPPWKRYLDLWEIFLPEEQLLLTLVGTSGGNTMFDPEPLKVIHWNGPKRGPYHILKFHPVLDQAIAFPPVEFYRRLHKAINNIGNKVITDAEGMKRLLLVAKQENPADIDAVNRARHGMTVALDRPDASKEVEFSTPNQQQLLVMMQLLQQINTQGGGFEQLGGINAPAPTATQDELKTNNANDMLGSMQNRVVAGLVKVFTDCDYWLFSPDMGDPLQQIPTQRPLGDTGYQIPFTMTADLHQGDTDAFRLQIAPYSYKYKSPAEELQSLMNCVQIVTQLAALTQQGVPIDMQYAVSLIARLDNSPFLERLLNPGAAQQVPDQAQIAQGEAPTQGVQNTTRKYIRQDRGGPSDPNDQMMQMMQMMPSANGQTQPTAGAA